MTIVQIIGLIVVLLASVVSGILIVKKSKSHDLLKWVLLFCFISLALTWIFSTANVHYYTGAEVVDAGFNQQGISDIPNIIFNAASLASDKIIFLLFLGAFYAILSKNKSYNKLVSKVAEKFKGKEILFTLISSLFVIIMTTFFRETFAVLAFIPFLISVILEMKLDKMTAFVATFGSLLVGLLGLTYGGDSLYWLSTYMEIDITESLLYRLFVLVIATVLFNFFTVLHVRKTLKKKNVNETDADPYKVEKVDKKASSVPAIILFVVLFIIIVLGYIDWSGIFKITIFDDFHNWLLGIKIGNFEVFRSILGSSSSSATDAAFGRWTINHLSAVLGILGLIVAICNKQKLDEIISTCAEGFKKVLLPIVLVIGTYCVLTTGYLAMYMPTINHLISGTSTFNPYLTTIAAFISNVLYTDLGLTGFAIAPYYAYAYVESAGIAHTIFTTMFGFVQLCIPTGTFLLIGLSYLKIEYKTWMKYIWMFALGMLVILIALYSIMTYI